MKVINLLLIVIILYSSGNDVYGQAKGCEVLLPAISGKYTGGCKQGKAEGNGRAEGTDQYQGQFKAGLPNGTGTYTWQNGDVFKGIFVMGLRQGQGSMAFKRAGKADSVVNGFWKNDVYSAEYVKPEKPFTIYQRSNYLARSDVRKNSNSKELDILFNVSNVSGGTSTLTQGSLAGAVISDIMVTRGAYSMVQDGAISARGSSKKLLQVSFPFRATVRIGGQDLDIEITEPGSWTVTLAMNQ